jgi:hypothetical protein
MSDARSRQLRAVLRTALTWGAAWAAAGGGILALLALFDANPAIESLPERVGMAVFAGVSWGVRFGIAGAVIGTLFSAAVSLSYAGRRLRDIRPARFALLGAVVGGVGVPLYLQLMNVLSGGGMLAWGLVSSDAVLGSVLGAAAAGGSILLARRADALSAGAEPALLDSSNGLDDVGLAEEPARSGANLKA